MSVLVWFRRDLRLADNPALCAACARGEPVIPVYLHTVDEDGEAAPGGASRWWLDASLRELDRSLRERGSELVVRRGRALDELRRLISETGAKAVFWNRLYGPTAVKRDTRVKAELTSQGLLAESFNGSLIAEPWELKNLSGRPFQVFTAFWNSAQKNFTVTPPVPAPRKISGPPKFPSSLSIDALGLLPKLPWAREFPARFTPGEAAAMRALRRFVDGPVTKYKTARDVPSQFGTSRLSPHLHFGEISPRQAWDAVADRGSVGAVTFRKEIFWREFAHHLLFHFPNTPAEALRPEFRSFPWKTNPTGLRAWQKGLTGYPIVDAGMRELWRTGWMHNRVRMIAGSFLVNDLLLSWQEGAAWFWDTLVDADLASNTLGWQWVGGCGADAAPFFRVFNPILQGEKFDPEGDYVREWVPELSKLPSQWIHRPWEAPAGELLRAGVSLGTDYPHPIVDHGQARLEALAAFKRFRGPGTAS